MKGKIKYLIVFVLTLLAFGTFNSTVYAANEHEFSFKAYKCNGEVDVDYAECTEDPVALSEGDTVTPGQIIQLDLWYKPNIDPSTMMQVGFFFDSSVVERYMVEGELVYLEPTPVGQGGIYPNRPGSTKRTNWAIDTNSEEERHEVWIIVEDDKLEQPLDNEGIMTRFFFTVKDDAPAGKTFSFTYDDAYTLLNTEAPFISHGLSLEVFGEKDADTTLSDLTVKNGTTNYLTSFNPETKSYTVYVPNNVSSVDIVGTPTKDTTSVVYDPAGGTYSLNVSTTKTVNLLTTAESGDTDTYTVNVYRLNNDATLSSLGLTNVDFGTFNKDTTTYTATVPFTTTSTTVSATPTDSTNATVSGTGNKSLDIGENTISVEVTPENCKSEYSSVIGNTCTKKTYTVTVTREPASEDAKLDDLKVDGTTVPGFDPETTTYTLDAVANNKTSITIEATSSEEHATITGTGNKNLSVGDNSFDVVVTAQDGTTKKTYTINIRRQNNDATLKSLTATSDPAGTLSPAFDKTKTAYTYNVDADEDEVVISAEPTDSNATVSGTGTYNPRTTSSVDIVVTAENGSEKTYTVTFDVAKSKNADLSDLGVTGQTITPAFDKDTLTYNVTVPSDTDKATITAELADDRASLTGTGEKTLNYGDNSFDVVVTAEDGTTKKTYTVNITREKKTDASVSDLKVDGVTVPGYDPETYEYTLPDVKNNKTSITIEATAADPDATITGTGNKNLQEGNNSFDVVVTAQDGTTKKTYTINIRRQSNDATLKSLTATSDPQGTLSPAFDSSTKTYTFSVGADVTEVEIDAEANDPNAIVTGTGKYNPNETSTVDVTVTGEDGTISTYTINIDRAKSDNADLSSLGVTGQTISPAFDKDTLTYNVTVPSDTDKATITAELADDRASLTGTGEKTLNYGDNSFDVVVTAEDGTTKKTYTVNITREKKTDATLSDLKVDGTTVPGFDPETYSYTLDAVANDKTSIEITYTTTDTDATVEGTGNKNLKVGDNSFDVVVTAQDGTTKKTYTINIYRKNDDTTLKSLTATSDPAGTLSPAFDPATTTYTYSVDADEDSVTISAEPTDPNATVSGTGTYNPRTDGPVEIIVTSENGTTKTYTVNFEVAKSSNADLSDLGVTGQTISPAFDKDTLTYNVTVPSDTDKATITAELADDRASLTGTGEKTLNYGDNSFDVVVTAEDGTEKTYTVNITREKKTDAKLSDLKVDGTTVPGFDPETYEYTLDDVENDKASVNITYVPSDTDATVTGDGNQSLAVGDNALKVTVTAQDGTTKKTYTINIYRKSDDTTLKSLTATSDPAGTLSPAFDPATTTYTYSVDADEDSVTISAEPTDPNATVSGTGTYNPRTDGPVEIIVTSENGTTKTYTVNFEVAKSSNADLSNLGVTGQTITPAFDKDTITYNVTVPSDTDKATITAEAADDRSTVTGTGEQDLNYGDNSFDVKVTAEDGTEKTYTVNITREKKTDAGLDDLQADDVTVPGFAVDKYEYDLGNVSSDKTTIKLSATSSDTDATIEGTGTKNLVVGENSFDVVVTAQDGTTKKTYTIKVKRLNSSKNLESLTVTSDPQGTLEPAFDPETTEYTYEADPDETEVIISATVPEGSNATIEGTGTYNPRETDKVEIVVKAEDGTEKTYTVNLTLAKSKNADLKSLGVTDETISPAFDKDTLTYNVTVPSDTDKATITAELADDRASLTGTGEKTLNYGDNSFDVVVTAEDGTKKTYTVNITREKKTDSSLTDIKVDGVSIPGFDPDVTEYTIDPVNSDKENIVIEATVSDPDATVSGTGTKTVQTGDNSFDVVVTAQDGTTTKTYTINVKKLSSDSTLKDITVTSDPQGTFGPAFDPAVTEYTYTAGPDVDSVTISATPTQDGAIVTGEGTYNPKETDTVELIVTAEDGSTKTYLVHLENEKSSNADLSNLGVTGETLSPAFDKDTTSYTVTVPSDTDKATITATAADSRSTVTGTGEQNLNYGSNNFDVVVTAEDGTKKTYTVNIERELSSDVKLKDLTVDGTTVDGFDPDTSTYTIPNVGNDVTSIVVGATPENENATVTGTGEIPLEVGNNTIEVTVTAQDGSKGTYTINVTREADSNNDLKSLEVEGQELSPAFDPDTTSYTVTVPSDVDKVTVNAEPDSDKATVTGTGEHELQPGENTIEVTVKAEDGTEKTYTITVTKEDDDEKITSIEYGHIIEDHMIKSVIYKSVPEELRNQLDNENWKLHIFDKDDTAEIDEEAKLGTGMIIKLIVNDTVKDDDYLVVKGDVDGNSRVALLDAVMVLNHYLENNELTGIWFEAGDMDSNGQVKLLDAVNILKVYLED